MAEPVVGIVVRRRCRRKLLTVLMVFGRDLIVMGAGTTTPELSLPKQFA